MVNTYVGLGAGDKMVTEAVIEIGRLAGKLSNVPSLTDRNALVTHPAWLDCRTAIAVRTNAIQTLGDNPRSRSFTCATNTSHDERMSYSISFKRVLQRPYHGVLTNKILKGLRTVFTG